MGSSADTPSAGHDDDRPATLHRTLGRWQLTLLGVSNAIGAGVIVLTGTMAANYAGPAATISFIIAGFVCFVTALCYAELSAQLPEAGSAYSYAYVSMGRPVAWMVGWCLFLGYLVAGSTVAVGWSGYFTAFLTNFGMTLPEYLSAAPLTISQNFELVPSGAIANLPASAVVLLCTCILMFGVRLSAMFNTWMVLVKLAAIGLFIVVGSFFIDPSNWTPFIPENTGQYGRFGWSGVFSAAVIAFFAYTGFEVISTSSQEAKDPSRDVPFALIVSFWICALLYVATTLVMTGMVPYPRLNAHSPMNVAILSAGPQLAWFAIAINAMVVVGLVSAILVSLYAQTRISMVMARDGMLSPALARIHPVHRTPVIGTAIVGAIAIVIAALLPLEILGELVSMGMLFCFMTVCLSVMILRIKRPTADRPFRVPFYPVTPLLGTGSCIYLVFSLPTETWSRLAIWLAIGAAVYLAYGRRKKPQY